MADMTWETAWQVAGEAIEASGVTTTAKEHEQMAFAIQLRAGLVFDTRQQSWRVDRRDSLAQEIMRLRGWLNRISKAADGSGFSILVLRAIGIAAHSALDTQSWEESESMPAWQPAACLATGGDHVYGDDGIACVKCGICR